jgi:Conjugative transposon protein TcpC
VAHLRFGGVVSRLDRGSARAPVLRTPADVLKRLGRVVLWLLVVVLLLRGLASLFASDAPKPAAAPAPLRAAVATWPDDEAKAFAADFARAYLSSSTESLDRYVTPELAATIAPEWADEQKPQKVGAVSVARVSKLGDDQALITVAATVGTDARYLSVPVTRDARGGLVVTALPSLVGPPAHAAVESPSLEPIASDERGGIEDVLNRFFSAYLAGDSQGLEYLVPAGTRIGALGQKYELLGMTSLALAAPAKGRTREVWASVRARDVQSRAIYGLRYRLTLVRDDRWYVQAVTGGG